MEDGGDNLMNALKTVIKKSMACDGLVKGLNQVGKHLDRKDAYLCILATDCDDPKYKKKRKALSAAFFKNKVAKMTMSVKEHALRKFKELQAKGDECVLSHLIHPNHYCRWVVKALLSIRLNDWLG